MFYISLRGARAPYPSVTFIRRQRPAPQPLFTVINYYIIFKQKIQVGLVHIYKIFFSALL